MKIEIPEWAEEGNITILWNNVEVVAYKFNGKNSPIMVKPEEGRCNQCGECCLGIGIDHYLADDEGKCKHLSYENKKWKCNAGGLREVNCFGDPSKKLFPDCSVFYEEQVN